MYNNERICFTNNRNGRNYGGDGEIAIVDDDGNTIEIINEDEVESGGFWTPQQQQHVGAITQFTIHAFLSQI